MWQWELAGVAFKIMILRDERGVCSSSICENVGIWTCPQSDIIGMFGIIAFTCDAELLVGSIYSGGAEHLRCVAKGSANLLIRQVIVLSDVLKGGAARQFTNHHFDRHARLSNHWTSVDDLWINGNPRKYLFCHLLLLAN